MINLTEHRRIQGKLKRKDTDEARQNGKARSAGSVLLRHLRRSGAAT